MRAHIAYVGRGLSWLWACIGMHTAHSLEADPSLILNRGQTRETHLCGPVSPYILRISGPALASAFAAFFASFFVSSPSAFSAFLLPIFARRLRRARSRRCCAVAEGAALLGDEGHPHLKGRA